MLTRRGSTADDDAGITLVEVLTAMVLSVIVGSLMVTYLISSVHNARRSDGQNEQAASARTVMDSWAAVLPLAVDPEGQSAPGAVRFYSLGPTSTRFCAAVGSKTLVLGGVDAVPIGIELALVGDDLVEKRYATCAGMVAGGAHVRRILVPSAAVAAAGAWILTPLAVADIDADAGAAGLLDSTLTSGSQTLIATTQADADKIAKVAGLQVAFRTLPASGRPAPPATYTMLLGLNAGG